MMQYVLLPIMIKKINPFHFIQKMESTDCSLAVKRLVPRIKKAKVDIYNMIDNNPVLTNVQKRFYRVILEERLNKVLIPTYKKVTEGDCSR